MADRSLEVDTALKSLLGGDSTLTTLCPGGVWWMEAPEEATFPRVVYQQVTGLDSYTYTGPASSWNRWQVVVVGRGNDQADAKQARERIRELLDDAILTGVTGASSCRRQRTYEFPERNDGEVYHHIGSEFVVMTSED